MPVLKIRIKKTHGMDKWSMLVVGLLWGSLFFGKASAYAAIATGALLIFDPRVLWGRWFIALTRRGDPFSGMAWALLVSLLYGFAQVIYGYQLGYPLNTALQILVFNICPVYIFLGVWVGARHPWIVRRYIRFIAWFMVVYTPLYALVFRKLTVSLSGILPGSNLDLLGSPGTGSSTLLGLLAYEPNLLRFWLPILVLSCLTIANQERADWLGLGLALTIWGFLAKRMDRVLTIAGTISAILLIAFITDFELPPIPGRGGEISARETIARMAASISPEMAESVGGDLADARFYYGTVYWRTHWWEKIRDEVSTDYKTLIFGLGYGYPLAKLAGREVEATGTRSPHSIFYFALAYSGWVGVVIFFWLEISIFQLLWRQFKVTGQIYGLAYFSYQFVGAFFGNFFETPQGGIYFYLLIGLLLGPMAFRLAAPAPVPRVSPHPGLESWSSEEAELLHPLSSMKVVPGR